MAEFVLHTEAHPSADEVHEAVLQRFPMISRATVYNTLNLFVEKGLIRRHSFADGHTVFDPNSEPHHHFIDDDSGEIFDLPWDALEVKQIRQLAPYDVRTVEVVLRGRMQKAK